MFDTIIKGGTLITSEGSFRGHLGISGGKVAAWFSDVDEQAEQVIDADGCVVIPGLFDCHVHIREPESREREDFVSVSSAAASSGITTIMVMPNINPPIDNHGTFQEVIRVGNSKSVVDFTVAVDANPNKTSEYPNLVQGGAASFEIAMNSFPEEGGFGLLGTMKEVSRLRVPLSVFSLDRFVVEHISRVLKEVQGRKDFLAHAEAYPSVSEVAGLARILILAKAAGIRLHLRQITTRPSIDLIQWAKNNHTQLTSEVNPHHLFLTQTDLERLGPVAKMIPPLRTEDDVEALWLGLRSRIIDVVSTDHAPHLDEEKRRGELDIWKAPSGIPGVETLLPLLLRAVHERRINWANLVGSACENPARIFGLYPRKGTLRPGADADLVQVDPTAEWSLKPSDLFSKAKLSPFCGLKFKGRPIMTMVRGQIVYEHREIQAPPGTGKFIRPQP